MKILLQKEFNLIPISNGLAGMEKYCFPRFHWADFFLFDNGEKLLLIWNWYCIIFLRQSEKCMVNKIWERLWAGEGKER